MKALNLILLFIISTLLSGCMGTSLLGEKEYLLRKQKVKGTQKIDKEALRELYRQETNRRIFFFPALPYVYLYEMGQRSYDTEKIRQKRAAAIEKYDKKIARAEAAEKNRKAQRLTNKRQKKIEKFDRALEEGNMFMRWGEPLVLLDSGLIESTAEQMQLYMKTKGFLEAESDYEIKYRRKSAIATYRVEEGPAYLIDTVVYRANDENIRRIVNSHADESHLIRDHRYDQENLTQERERLYSLMRDNGYFTFDRQYINFRVYDTLTDSRLAIETIINDPRQGQHRVYRVDSVIFNTDESIYGRTHIKNVSSFNGVTYRFNSRHFSEKILSQRIFIQQDSLYSQESTLETQRQLANLDNFKFINIFYDSAGSDLTANIYASPLKKFQTTNEVGLGFIVSEGYPSPFYNFSLKNRNVFGGLENLELNARIGKEGVPSATDPKDIYRSTEAGGNFSLTFPQFALPLGPRLKRQLGTINPKTKVIAGATLSNRDEYLRTTFNTSLAYTWQKDLNVHYTFTFLDLNLIDTKNIEEEFWQTLIEYEQAGNLLINSFRPSFVNSMALSASYNYNQYGFSRKASLLKLFVENGGTFLNITGTDFLGDNLQHYKFFKTSIDFRRYRPLEKTNTLAMRFFLGVAVPYGESDILPYEKYFFAGGSNGIRAWRPRRLGPGSYAQLTTLASGAQVYDDSFEQHADILLEANVELRRKIIGFLEGALFVDVGNSWTIKQDGARPGAQFELDRFYKEIAVGAGVGARLDFSFLIIRFDWGLKVYDPARPLGSRFIFNESFNDGPFENAENYTLNLGIGYPF